MERKKMKRGDRLECPNCGQSTIAKEKVVMDGWTAKEKILICTLCGEKVGEIETDADVAVTETENSALSGLSALLGEEPEEKIKLTAEGSERHFCRDCVHYVAHPFLSRCELHKKNVNPMDDCPDYIQNKKEENADE
jgi:hypothetical protein